MVEQTRIQPELIELLARQLDRCGPANLTVPVCSACPPWPTDNSLLLLLAGAVAAVELRRPPVAWHPAGAVARARSAGFFDCCCGRRRLARRSRSASRGPRRPFVGSGAS